jgi:hypothetical protein
MDSQIILNIVTICISTILSLGAILLSIWFYQVSNKQNKETALMQTDIKNAIEKLEQLYDRTYTDTFGALKTQLDAMQKHIFTSSVGETNNSEPNNLRFYVIGCVTDKTTLSIDQLCNEVKGFNRTEITETVYKIHREGLVEFDGNNIKYLKADNNQSVTGQGDTK